MKSMVLRAWQAACQESSAIIYGNYLRTKLNPRFNSAPGERLCSYLFSSNDYSRTKGIVHFTAFFPPSNLRKSVYWISRLLDHHVWSIGSRHVAPYRGQIKARANVRSHVLYLPLNLAVRLTSKPHPRHADIVRWDADRRKRRLEAEKIADESTLSMFPGGYSVPPSDLVQDVIRLRVAGSALLVLVGMAAAFLATIVLIVS